MVVQDGHSYVKRMANILDNMIAAKRLPAMVVVLPDSGGSDAQGSERGLEYDTVSDRYSNWVETELLPAVTQRITASPSPPIRKAAPPWAARRAPPPPSPWPGFIPSGITRC